MRLLYEFNRRREVLNIARNRSSWPSVLSHILRYHLRIRNSSGPREIEGSLFSIKANSLYLFSLLISVISNALCMNAVVIACVQIVFCMIRTVNVLKEINRNLVVFWTPER